MRNSAVIIAVVSIICMMFSACDYYPKKYEGTRPTAYTESTWLCQMDDVTIYFSVDENHEVFNGIYMDKDHAYEIARYVFFPGSSLGTLSVPIGWGLLNGYATFDENYFILHVTETAYFDDIPAKTPVDFYFQRIPYETENRFADVVFDRSYEQNDKYKDTYMKYKYD